MIENIFNNLSDKQKDAVRYAFKILDEDLNKYTEEEVIQKIYDIFKSLK